MSWTKEPISLDKKRGKEEGGSGEEKESEKERGRVGGQMRGDC